MRQVRSVFSHRQQWYALLHFEFKAGTISQDRKKVSQYIFRYLLLMSLRNA